MPNEVKIPMFVIGAIFLFAIIGTTSANVAKHVSNKQSLQCFELLKDRSTTDLAQLCGKVS